MEYNPAVFEDERWNRREVDAPNRERIRSTIESIPSDVESILDVGCSNGKLTNPLKGKYCVFGMERVFSALRTVEAPCVCADIEAIPFAEGAVDCVLCTEVIEHLPDDMMARAISEMKRVSKRYLLITVPNEDSIEEGLMRCAKCGTVFHAVGHLRRFDAESLEKLFERENILMLKKIVEQKRRVYSPGLLRFKHAVLGAYGRHQASTCPRCGNREFRPTIGTCFGWLVSLINRIIHPIKKKKLRWILILLEKKNNRTPREDKNE